MTRALRFLGMRIRSIAVALALTGLAVVPTAALAAPPLTDEHHSDATLAVVGHGLISRAPDLATIAVAIVTNDAAAARALSENNTRFAALTAKLSASGIASGDIISTSISSYFNVRPANSASNAGGPFGYVVTRSVEVNVRALGATGSVVDAATAAGATQVNGVTYGFRDRPTVERAALAAAVTDAYAQAQTIAGAAHVQIVRVLRIGDDNEASGRIIQPQAMMMSRAAKENVPTTIAPSDLDITSSISITYIIR